MRQYFNWLLGKPISPEIRSLLNAINSGRVEWTGEIYDGAAIVVYNGVRVCAYLLNTNFGYTVDIGFCSRCLPRHEARVVYKALVRFRKRSEENLEKLIEKKKQEIVRNMLNPCLSYTDKDNQT